MLIDLKIYYEKSFAIVRILDCCKERLVVMDAPRRVLDAISEPINFYDAFLILNFELVSGA